MKFFYKYFGTNNYISDQNEMHVLCPFPHTDPTTGEKRLEKNPSAHINIDKSVFHCKACDIGISEPAFLAKVQGISYPQALQMLAEMEDKEDEDSWSTFVNNLKQSDVKMNELLELKLNDMVDTLQLGYAGSGIIFPIFVYGEKLAECEYHPNPKEGQKKTYLSKGAKNLIFPFDLWRKDERDTLLCAGFKDAAIARKYGFNAITFTHGEHSFPKLFKGSFKDRKVYIVYDNDETGIEGAKKAATFIKESGGYPYVVLGHHTVCTGLGEDIHDFFIKYGKTANDLQEIIQDTPAFSEEDYQKQRNEIYPLVMIEESAEEKYTRKLITSRVTVVASWEDYMKVPAAVTFEKVNETDKCTIPEGTIIRWFLETDNLADILYLCDSNLKDTDVLNNLKMLVGIPKKEKHIRITIDAERTVWKAAIMDDMESEVIGDMETSYKPAEMTVYSVDRRLHSGEKYRIFYRTVPHPIAGQKVVAVTDRVEESDNSINRFKVTESVIESLKCFQGDVKKKMKEQVDRIKAFAGVETLPQLAWTVDLFYHTPLQFKFGERVERAYLEPMIVGESRTGKSQTAKKLLEMYELGVFTSLKTSTVAGLIGGSDQTAGGWRTRLGVLPRNHKGAVIMEEFSGGGKEIASKLTEIRSSNKVRITRVNGTTVADAMVRMLSISNQASNSQGHTIPLRQYPNGINVLLDLIGAAEDIGRYDFFVLVDKPSEYTSPTETIDIEPYPKESYLNRVRWIWSRKPDQIVINEQVQQFIVDTANELNQVYDCHINFFGSEAWKKLARVSIAVAACVASMDETGEKCIVNIDHVRWARNFLIACYDNDLFKLREYAEGQRKYTQCPSSAVAVLQGLYNTQRTLINYMEMQTEMSQTQLRAVSGLEPNDFNKVINKLTECYFIVPTGDKIVPSQRFRKAIAQVKRNIYMTRVGAE